jgi:hypothetical protein
MTTTEKLQATKLFSLAAEAQDLLPEHTYKAVMLRASSRDSVEGQCELLEDVVGDFRRGML